MGVWGSRLQQQTAVEQDKEPTPPEELEGEVPLDPPEPERWGITRPRIFQLLDPCNSVLIAGCGGGYDVLSGLPIYHALREQGKRVVLANLSFTLISRFAADAYETFCSDVCVCVTPGAKPKQGEMNSYFPERYLTNWLEEKTGDKVPIYTFKRETGVADLTAAYQAIASKHKLDAIVLVDGGTDSLMFGSEERMGTPVEDQTSLAAVNGVEGVPVKILACLGFGVDSFHGVSHGLFLENVATLERAGGYLGAFSVSRHSAEGRFYAEGYRAVAEHMQSSIVCASITDAMEGHFGDHHSTCRTKGSKLFINPLMALYWTFLLPKVVSQIPYASTKEFLQSKGANEVMKVIAQHQEKTKLEGKTRKPTPLPM